MPHLSDTQMKIVYTSVRPCLIVVLIDNVAAQKHKIS